MSLLFWIAATGYFASMAGALYWAWRRPRSLGPKASAIVAVAVVFSVLPAAWIRETLNQDRALERRAEYKRAAWEHFRKLCNEKAGEKIHRVVRDVDGFLLERPRVAPKSSELADKNWMGDPYGNDYYGNAELAAYLYPLNEAGVPTTAINGGSAYAYVEVPTRNEKAIVRYTRAGQGSVSKGEVPTVQSRFAVRWEDISTPEDRQFWVAGGRLQVVDMTSNEVLGERIGYLIDARFGSTAGGRRPWLHARLTNNEVACPPFRRNAAINRLFVEKVLVPH